MNPSFDQMTTSTLYPCAPEDAFRFDTGDVARHVGELRDLIDRIDRNSLDARRGDLADWLQNVANDPALAGVVRKAVENDGLEGQALRDRLVRAFDARLQMLADDANLTGRQERLARNRRAPNRSRDRRHK